MYLFEVFLKVSQCTFARMKLSATIALGTARLIKERLPIRIGSDGRVLPTGAAAVRRPTPWATTTRTATYATPPQPPHRASS